jgi:hypothetical protein
MCKAKLPIFLLAIFSMTLACCKQNAEKDSARFSETEVVHRLQDELTQVIIYDVFTPPVASRIYAYTSLAGYEAMRWADSSAWSLTERMHGFEPMPRPEPGKKYDFGLAYTSAFAEMANHVIFSKDTLKVYLDEVYAHYAGTLDKEVYDNSMAFGKAVGEKVWLRAKDDNYLKSRSKPKYLGSEEPGKWRPTPPDYLDGVEFCWNEIHALVLDSASQFLPPPPPPYNMDSGSIFYNMAKEVYTVSNNLTPEQQEIARFWDDNPFVMEHAGHLSFGTKKITPGGHWMGIAAIAARQTGAGSVKTAKTYALTATALLEAFISSWDAKYTWSYVRPITVIHEYWQKDWKPLLQTPPFPEYTSGHSTITAAAAEVLTHLYGDNFAFNDTSDLRYIGMQRKFTSFYQAADECSVSRLYGGIHYRLSTDEGANAGRKVGALIVTRLGSKSQMQR